MKSQIIKFVALIALLAGGISISAQNNKTNSVFAIDKNIISFEVANLEDKLTNVSHLSISCKMR